MWHAAILPERPEERRFVALLAASALLHATLIAQLNLPPREVAGTGYPVLSVVLKKLAPPPAIESAEPALPPLFTEAATPPLRATPTLNTAKPPMPAVAPEQSPLTESSAAPTPRPAITPPAPGRDAQGLAAAGGVSAHFLIGEQGRIHSILWNRLPALTNDQFQRLEALLRENEYPHAPAGSTLTEMVDVRGLLGLPPVRGSEPRLPPP